MGRGRRWVPGRVTFRHYGQNGMGNIEIAQGIIGEDKTNTMGEFASRFTGSSDLYQNNSRLPYASVNFITAHDGFTLNDLVSYNGKHNEANKDEKSGW